MTKLSCSWLTLIHKSKLQVLLQFESCLLHDMLVKNSATTANDTTDVGNNCSLKNKFYNPLEEHQ